jgi:hypothetical protein
VFGIFQPFLTIQRTSRTPVEQSLPPLQRSRQGRIGAGRHQHKGRRRNRTRRVGTGSVEQVQDSAESPWNGDQNGEIPGEIIHFDRDLPFEILVK